MKRLFSPVPQEELDRIAQQVFEQSRIVIGDQFVGAGRNYSDRGTPGYVDNLLDIEGVDVKRALREAQKAHPDRQVQYWDVGCANGKAMVDMLRFAAHHLGIDVLGTGFAAIPKEFISNPPTKSGVFRPNGAFIYHMFTSTDRHGATEDVTARFRTGDIHRIQADITRPDVVASMACIKYSHNPWHMFADLLRRVQPDGRVYIGHLVDGTGKVTSKSPIYTIDRKEITPRQYTDALMELNPGLQIVANEDTQRRVPNQDGQLVRNTQKFYAGDKALNAYRAKLVAQRRGARTPAEKASIDEKLKEVSGNGFFNVSVAKNGLDDVFFGLVYAGHQKDARGGVHTRYLFVPDRAKFDKVVNQKGYVPV